MLNVATIHLWNGMDRMDWYVLQYYKIVNCEIRILFVCV